MMAFTGYSLLSPHPQSTYTAASALLSITLAAFALTGCDDNDANEEVISAFQAVGISRQPVFAKPSAAGTIAFHFLAPKGFSETLTFTNQLPEGAAESLPLAVQTPTLSPDGSFGDALSELSYYKVVAQYVLPDAAELGMTAQQPYLAIPIQVAIEGAGTTRVITASLPTYLEGHPAHQEAEGRALAVTIAEPGDSGGTDQELTAKGTLTDTLPLDKGRFTVAWFSSGGKIDNVRAIDTKWRSGKTAGPYNLVLTVRGNSSKEFAIAVKKVTVGP